MFSTIAVIVLGILLIASLAILFLRGRREAGTYVQDEVGLPEGFVPPSAALETPSGMVLLTQGDLDKLHADIAELNRQIGENQAAHRAEIVTVKSQAITDVHTARSEMELEFSQRKRSDAQATAARSRTALVAKIAEHFAPLLRGFPYNYKDARHVGEIFDFLVFDGLEDGEIKQVVFLEVKTKKSGARVTNPREKMLRDAIRAGRISYEVFVPDTGDAKTDRSTS